MVRSLVLLVLAALTGVAHALDFRSVSETAVLYDAPSQKAKPLYVVAAGTPVEAIVTLDVWVKVRDMAGDLAWIERRQLADKRMLQVRKEGAEIRSAPDESAAAVFTAEPDVLLEWLEPAEGGWLKVRHRSGQQGYVRAGRVWGQ